MLSIYAHSVQSLCAHSVQSLSVSSLSLDIEILVSKIFSDKDNLRKFAQTVLSISAHSAQSLCAHSAQAEEATQRLWGSVNS